jgi:hypothetical protein
MTVKQSDRLFSHFTVDELVEQLAQQRELLAKLPADPDDSVPRILAQAMIDAIERELDRRPGVRG